MTVDCLNCDAPLTVKPCAHLEVAPWEDGETDPELDALREDARFEPRTVREALPLLKALAKPRLVLDEPVINAMGLRGITSEFLTNCTR